MKRIYWVKNIKLAKKHILECPSKLLPNPAIVSTNDLLRILDVLQPHISIAHDILCKNLQGNKLRYNNTSIISAHIN